MSSLPLGPARRRAPVSARSAARPSSPGAGRRFLTSQEFRQAARAGRAGGLGVLTVGTLGRAAGDSRTFKDVIFSDGSIDRYGDSIDQKGWQLEAFRSNPVALWSHDSSSPPIGR